MSNIPNLIVFFFLVLVTQDCQQSCLLRWRGFLQILILEISVVWCWFFLVFSPEVGDACSILSMRLYWCKVRITLLISVGCLTEETWLNGCLQIENVIPVRSEYFKQHVLPSLVQKPGNCYRTRIMLSKKTFEAGKINQSNKNNLYTNSLNRSKSTWKMSPELFAKLLVLHQWDL